MSVNYSGAILKDTGYDCYIILTERSLRPVKKLHSVCIEVLNLLTVSSISTTFSQIAFSFFLSFFRFIWRWQTWCAVSARKSSETNLRLSHTCIVHTSKLRCHMSVGSAGSARHCTEIWLTTFMKYTVVVKRCSAPSVWKLLHLQITARRFLPMSTFSLIIFR